MELRPYRGISFSNPSPPLKSDSGSMGTSDGVAARCEFERIAAGVVPSERRKGEGFPSPGPDQWFSRDEQKVKVKGEGQKDKSRSRTT